MIPQSKDISVVSTLEPEHTIAMSIDPMAARHLMDILSGIYSDDEMAVIREYTTNAMDSHIEAGVNRPVEIKTPSRLFPWFEVRDYGIGMSIDDIKNIYSMYGASTKRNTQDQTGSIGIGAKSALAYGAEFTVEAIKNGKKAVVLVGRDENGDGVMEVLAETDSDQDNGVLIRIPVNSNFDSFCSKIKKFHKYVTPGKLLVDGEHADRSEFIKLKDDMYAIARSGYYSESQTHIVMGEVAYPINFNEVQRFHDAYDVIIFVEMGAVKFTPSREELYYDNQTRALIDKYRTDFNNNLIEYLQKTVDDCIDAVSAFNLSIQHRKSLGYVNSRDAVFTYQGKELPGRNNFQFETTCVSWSPRLFDGKPKSQYDYFPKCHTTPNYTISDLKAEHVFVKNWDNKRFTKTQAEKLHLLIEQLGIDDPGAAFMLTTDFNMFWLLKGLTVIDYADVRKMKGTINSNRRKKNEARKYQGLGDGRALDDYVPDSKNKIWYGSKYELKLGRNTNWATRMQDFSDLNGHEFYYVADNELEKFIATYPKAKHYTEFYKEQVNDYINNISDEDRSFIINQDGIRHFHLLDESLIEDPELKMLVKFGLARNGNSPILTKWRLMYKYLESVCSDDREQLLKLMPKGDRKVSSKILNRYPLLNCSYGYSDVYDLDIKRAMTDYCNWRYKIYCDMFDDAGTLNSDEEKES